MRNRSMSRFAAWIFAGVLFLAGAIASLVSGDVGFGIGLIGCAVAMFGLAANERRTGAAARRSPC